MTKSLEKRSLVNKLFQEIPRRGRIEMYLVSEKAEEATGRPAWEVEADVIYATF